MPLPPQNVNETAQLTVYFDGACPHCRKEIGWYKKQHGAEEIVWLDVSQSSEAMVAKDLCTADALKRFHVRTIDGRIVSGASAFAELWLRMPRFRFAGALVKIPLVSRLAELAYRFFLKIRPSIQRRFRCG